MKGLNGTLFPNAGGTYGSLLIPGVQLSRLFLSHMRREGKPKFCAHKTHRRYHSLYSQVRAADHDVPERPRQRHILGVVIEILDALILGEHFDLSIDTIFFAPREAETGSLHISIASQVRPAARGPQHSSLCMYHLGSQYTCMMHGSRICVRDS